MRTITLEEVLVEGDTKRPQFCPNGPWQAVEGSWKMGVELIGIAAAETEGDYDGRRF